MTDDAEPTAFERGDHTEIARRIIKQMREASGTDESPVFDQGKLRSYDHDSGLWMEVEKHQLIQSIAQFEGYVTHRDGKVKDLILDYSDISGVIKVIYGLVDKPGFFDSAPSGVRFSNVFVSVERVDGRWTIVQSKPSPDHRATFALPFDYDPNADCPAWKKYLDEVFTHPSELIDESKGGATKAEREAFALDRRLRIAALMEWLGVCLVGMVIKFQVCVILNGEGANGKSVFIDVIRRLFSPAAVCSIKPQLWSQRFSVAGLANRLVNLVNEVPDAELAGGDAFKAVTTGDPIEGERKYQDPFTLKSRCGHMFACNKLMGTSDQTLGFWRRWLVILFDRIFDERNRDVDLTFKLTVPEELRGIAALAIASSINLLNRGKFVIPASSEDAKLEWKMDSDQVMQFIEECCEACHVTHTTDCDGDDSHLCHPTRCKVHCVSGPDLYPYYREWSKACGYKVLARNNFLARLKPLGHARRTKTEKWYALAIRAGVAERYIRKEEHHPGSHSVLRKKIPAWSN